MALMKFREPNQVKWQGSRPGHNGTQILAERYAVNAKLPIYTVLAGQTFYLCTTGMACSVFAAGLGIVGVETGGGVTVVNLLYDNYVAGSNLFTKNVTFWPPLEVPALHDVFVFSSALVLEMYGWVFGWVE